MLQGNRQVVFLGWRSKSHHECNDTQSNENHRSEHDKNGILRRGRLS